MSRRLQTVAWYLKRPALYPELVRLVLPRLVGSATADPRDSSQAEARQWCDPRAVTIDTAIEKIAGAGRQSIESLFPQVLQAAHQRAAACPVRMGGPGGLKLLYWLAEHIQATRVVETGVAYGWSSLALLLSLRKRPQARLISVDMPYPMLDNDAYVGCVVPADLRSQWEIVRRADREGLPRALRRLGGIDMCHYDSDKSYRGRMWAYPLLWESLRSGGFLLSDDVSDNIAFRDFVAAAGVDPVIIAFEGKHIGIVRR